MRTVRRLIGYLVWGAGIGIGFGILAPDVAAWSTRWIIAVGVVLVLTGIGDRLSGWRSRKVECPHCGKTLRYRTDASDRWSR